MAAAAFASLVGNIVGSAQQNANINSQISAT